MQNPNDKNAKIDIMITKESAPHKLKDINIYYGK